MSGRGKNYGKRNRNYHTLSSVARENAVSLPADSPILTMFRQAALKLTERQDRHERLVKLSRDVTIESKRIIFLLHSAIMHDNAEKAVNEAKERLQKLVRGPLQTIGYELENCPAYLHSNAITAGLQEYIEARTFCSLMEKKEIITYSEVQKELTYNIKDISEDGKEIKNKTVVTLIPPTDYMLGLSDLTGEMMRKAINSISSGDSEQCFYACQVVRDLYTGFLGLFGIGRELARKMGTTRNNVAKIEYVVYTLRVRGGEAPPILLLSEPAQHNWESNNNPSDDEGCF